MTDHRIEAAAKALGEKYRADEGLGGNAWCRISKEDSRAVLAAADAADRDVGIVRVDTRDDATIMRVAAAIGCRTFAAGRECIAYEDHITDARAAIGALAEDDQ